MASRWGKDINSVEIYQTMDKSPRFIKVFPSAQERHRGEELREMYPINEISKMCCSFSALKMNVRR